MESAENQPQPRSSNESAAESNPTLSKTETIALLNESIDRLEETIAKIGKDPTNMPLSKSINTLLTTTQELEDAVTSTEVKVSTSIPTVRSASPPEKVSKSERSQDVRQNVSTISKARKQPKKNLGLIVIGVTAVAIVIVTIFWLWQPQQLANLLPHTEKQPAPAGVVVAPITDIVTQPLETTSLKDTIETIDSTPDNLGIVSDISAMDFPPEIEPVAEPIEDVVETLIPEELEAPDRPKKLTMVKIEPKLDFTPEQNLVASLETKVSELVETYGGEFIQEVRADLTASSLLVSLTDDWYNLDESDQNSLGNEILERSRAFRFQKLELKDNLGISVARNPIVGENIIILQNSKE